MKWKDLITPVRNITPDQLKEIISRGKDGEYVLLDVRQPKEYRQSHLPGAVLIPLAQLDARIDEIDKDKIIVPY